jgi:hypothetical protein
MYGEHAELITDGAGRKAIAKALLGELSLYGAVADSDELTRARERAYYLAIALCDATTSTGKGAVGASDDLLAEHRFRRHVLAMHVTGREELLRVYENFLAVSDRHPVHDVKRIERVVSAFLEGALVARRIAGGHGELTERARVSETPIALDDDELVDAVLRIFIAMSRPVDGVGIDPDAILFKRAPAQGSTSAEIAVHRDRKAMYKAVFDAVERLPAEATISHSALHTSGARPSRTREGEALKAAFDRFLERGGEVRNVEKIAKVEELERSLERLNAEDPRHRRWLRVLVMDSPPALSPLILGDQAAFLGREVDGLIVDGTAFTDEVGRGWCEDHFETLWNDDRAYTLASPNGLNDRGIRDARRQLEESEHLSA